MDFCLLLMKMGKIVGSCAQLGWDHSFCAMMPLTGAGTHGFCFDPALKHWDKMFLTLETLFGSEVPFVRQQHYKSTIKANIKWQETKPKTAQHAFDRKQNAKKFSKQHASVVPKMWEFVSCSDRRTHQTCNETKIWGEFGSCGQHSWHKSLFTHNWSVFIKAIGCQAQSIIHKCTKIDFSKPSSSSKCYFCASSEIPSGACNVLYFRFLIPKFWKKCRDFCRETVFADIYHL